MHVLMLSDVYFPRINGVSTSIATFRESLATQGIRCTLVRARVREPRDRVHARDIDARHRASAGPSRASRPRGPPDAGRRAGTCARRHRPEERGPGSCPDAIPRAPRRCPLCTAAWAVRDRDLSHALRGILSSLPAVAAASVDARRGPRHQPPSVQRRRRGHLAIAGHARRVAQLRRRATHRSAANRARSSRCLRQGDGQRFRRERNIARTAPCSSS
jgi:hypothetical protein